MQIKRLVIENFKSIERIELVEPNPFTVFVGPNGSGKSNIFEALEFHALRWQFGDSPNIISLFGGNDNIIRRQANTEAEFDIETGTFHIKNGFSLRGGRSYHRDHLSIEDEPDFVHLIDQFSRLFISNERLAKLKYTDDKALTLSASNMETVLKRLLEDEEIKREIYDWLSLFVPGFEAVEVVSGSLSRKDTLLVYEKGLEQPFTRELISDGTYNIIALLTAVYQSSKPQFLCIEEPENGLNPKVARELVQLFRFACEELGHYIWLNTHSQSLVSVLTPEEVVLVDKRDGATQTKQIKGMNIHGLPMDVAWLSNALGGGIPW